VFGSSDLGMSLVSERQPSSVINGVKTDLLDGVVTIDSLGGESFT